MRRQMNLHRVRIDWRRQASQAVARLHIDELQMLQIKTAQRSYPQTRQNRTDLHLSNLDELRSQT
jgi:hypothetical protein